MEIVQIWWEIRAVRSAQCSKWSAFTSEGSKHCIIFISASHTLNQNQREGRCPLLAAEIPIVPFLFILLLLLLRDQWSRCNTYYRGFQDQRISWRWLEINLHNPPRSFPSPSLPFSPHFFSRLTLGTRQKGCTPREASQVFEAEGASAVVGRPWNPMIPGRAALS